MPETRNGNGLKGALGRLALQLLVPAIAAALASYLGVSVRLAKVEVRQEERFESLRETLQLRDRLVELQLTQLRKTDEEFGTELARLRERVP